MMKSHGDTRSRNIGKGDITSQVICAYALGKIIFRVA
jgi:hypothetical protein